MSGVDEQRQIVANAITFVKNYYAKLDDASKRGELCEVYFEGAPVLLEWNGYPMVTRQQVFDYFSQLPSTKHEVNTADAHALPGCTNSDSILVTVNGSVKYDDEHMREFFQRFVLRRNADAKYYVVNDYYRWLSAKN